WKSYLEPVAKTPRSLSSCLHPGLVLITAPLLLVKQLPQPGGSVRNLLLLSWHMLNTSSLLNEFVLNLFVNLTSFIPSRTLYSRVKNPPRLLGHGGKTFLYHSTAALFGISGFSR